MGNKHIAFRKLVINSNIQISNTTFWVFEKTGNKFKLIFVVMSHDFSLIIYLVASQRGEREEK